MTHVADALTIDPNQRLQQGNHDLKTVQAGRIATLEEDIDRNRKDTEHLRITREAVKGALDARSKAAHTGMKDALGWK
jgi:hypothetical protein